MLGPVINELGLRPSVDAVKKIVTTFMIKLETAHKPFRSNFMCALGKFMLSLVPFAAMDACMFC